MAVLGRCKEQKMKTFETILRFQISRRMILHFDQVFVTKFEWLVINVNLSLPWESGEVIGLNFKNLDIALRLIVYRRVFRDSN